MVKQKLTAEEAFLELHNRIINGDIKPGERIRESAVAEEFGLSRTPVRESLRRLESSGLLIHQAHKGVVVRQLDHQEVVELYLMREVLEGTAAALAARHASDAEIAALYDLLEEQEISIKDPLRGAKINKLFHKALYCGAHNRFLLEMLNSLSLSMALLGRTTLSLRNRAEEALAEHRAILDAVKARDPIEAEKCARRHIHAAHKARLRILFEDDNES